MGGFNIDDLEGSDLEDLRTKTTFGDYNKDENEIDNENNELNEIDE